MPAQKEDGRQRTCQCNGRSDFKWQCSANRRREKSDCGRVGRLGGLKGGHARAASMSQAQRSESAKKAAVARWSQEG